MADITVSGPDGSTFSFPAGTSADVITGAMKSHYGASPQASATPSVSPVADFFRSIPGGIVGGMSNALSTGGQAAQIEMGQPVDVPGTPQTRQIVEQNVTGKLPEPQGRAGKFGQSVGEFVGNPASYIGPGSLPLKVGGAVLGGLGSEAGGQAAEGTRYEGVARVAGALAGGGAASRMLGPSAPEAAVPTYPELKASYKQGYKNAIQSGVELQPNALGQFADYATNHISTDPELSFTTRSAPETFAVLNDMRNPPASPGATATITAANINQIKRDLNGIAGKTQPTQTPGVFQSTPDAVAAMAVRDKFNQYLENIPQDHVVAGDPEAYRLALQQANGDYAAAQRLKATQGRIDTAQENAAGQIAGSVDQQLRGQMRGLLKSSASRSYNPDERLAVQSVNRGNLGSNILTQLGRGGAGVVPMAAQAAVGVPAAIATGGASVIPQIALATALYAARKGGEVLTEGRAQKLAELIAKRSPLYQSRVNALPPADTMSGKAAVLRALLNGASQ